MAEFAIIVVPRDAHFVPSPSAVQAARALMADFFPTNWLIASSEQINLTIPK